MSNVRHLLPQSGPPRITLAGVDNKFWFSSEIDDWHPAIKKYGSGSLKKGLNAVKMRATNFRKMNDAISFRKAEV